MSYRRAVNLGDSEAEQHTIVFEHGRMVNILCPKVDVQQYSRRKGTRRGK